MVSSPGSIRMSSRYSRNKRTAVLWIKRGQAVTPARESPLYNNLITAFNFRTIDPETTWGNAIKMIWNEMFIKHIWVSKNFASYSVNQSLPNCKDEYMQLQTLCWQMLSWKIMKERKKKNPTGTMPCLNYISKFPMWGVLENRISSFK